MSTAADDTGTLDVATGNTYDKYGSANPIERRLMTGFFDALDASLPATAPTRILEVGAGEGEVAGRVAARYPDAALTVIDLPDWDLAADWRRSGIAGSFADITRLPFTDDQFDLVLGIEVLEHVPDPDAALAELARVASRDVVFSVPREPLWRVLNMARGKYWKELGNTPGHIQHWSSSAFAEAVGRHFDVVTTRRPLPWTMVSAAVRR